MMNEDRATKYGPGSDISWVETPADVLAQIERNWDGLPANERNGFELLGNSKDCDVYKTLYRKTMDKIAMKAHPTYSEPIDYYAEPSVNNTEPTIPGDIRKPTTDDVGSGKSGPPSTAAATAAQPAGDTPPTFADADTSARGDASTTAIEEAATESVSDVQPQPPSQQQEQQPTYYEATIDRSSRDQQAQQPTYYEATIDRSSCDPTPSETQPALASETEPEDAKTA
eukprot:UC1_evm1s589